MTGIVLKRTHRGSCPTCDQAQKQAEAQAEGTGSWCSVSLNDPTWAERFHVVEVSHEEPIVIVERLIRSTSSKQDTIDALLHALKHPPKTLGFNSLIHPGFRFRFIPTDDGKGTPMVKVIVSMAHTHPNAAGYDNVCALTLGPWPIEFRNHWPKMHGRISAATAIKRLTRGAS